ncbi:hypothetical protein INR49_023528 [Caranx melampygus]|nr:hypothetical protein INR49_023528 [Caranx melampygus]
MVKRQLDAAHTAQSLCPSSGLQFTSFSVVHNRPTDYCLLSRAGFSGWPLGTECPMEDHDNMDYFYQQVLQKDVTRRLQVGQDLIDYLNDPHRSPDVEQDKPRLDKTIDELTGWVNSSNFKVALMGIDICGAFVDRMGERFKGYLGTVLPALVDRLGDGKDQYVWERLLPGFKHKNFRSREGVCLCLSATLST